jgi:branched-chain amino acid transport system substrate-binding protein
VVNRAISVIAAAAIAAVTVAACSSSNQTGSGGSAPASKSGSGSAHLSGDPVLIYQVSTYSDPHFAVPEQLDGANAAAAYVNAHGGVAGHPLKLVTCNGGLDPNLSSACIQKGISAGAAAFVGSFTAYGGPTFDALKAAKIPWIDGQSSQPLEQTSPLSYPGQGGSIGQTYGMAYLAIKQLHLSKVAAIGDTTNGGKFNTNMTKQVVEAFGGKVTSTVLYPIGTVDMAGPVNQLLEGKPDAILSQSPTASLVTIIKAARQAGFTGPIITQAAVMQDTIAAKLGPSAQPLYVASDFRFPWIDNANFPAGQAFTKLVKAQNSNVTLSSWAVLGYSSVIIFAAVMTKYGKSLDSAGVIAAFNRASAVDTQGLTPTLDFTKTGALPGCPRCSSADVWFYASTGSGLKSLSTDWTNPLP